MTVATAAIVIAGAGMAMSASAQNKATKAGAKVQGDLAVERGKDRALLEKQMERYEGRIKEYEKSEFVPLDAEALKQENIYEEEDLTKDVLPAADYAKEQFQQQQANIMQSLKGVAGASGVAGLAQALSGQATQQARETGVSIGQQLAMNRKLSLAEESRLKTQERQIMLANMEGRNAYELDKMATLLGVGGARVAGTRTSLANIMSAQAGVAGAQMTSAATYGAGMMQAGGTALAGVSDRKLKEDINLIGESPSGLNIYSFKYIDPKFGEGTYQGVMADEVPNYAVIHGLDGYDMVDYGKIDVNFKQI